MENHTQDVNTSYQYMPKPPSWLTKWGTSLIALVFICFLGVVFMFPYPNTIEGKLTILQEGNKKNVGNLKLPSKDLEQLVVGQKVSIHLYRYPFSAYGALLGNVSYISEERDVNGEHNIKVIIERLITTHDKQIPSNVKLEGKAIVNLPETSMFEMLVNHRN